MMKKNWIEDVAVGGALLVLMLSASATLNPATLSRAQNAPAPQAAAPATASAAREPGAAHVANPGGTATADIGRGVRYLKRNVQGWQEGEDFIFYADEVTQYEKDNTATARLNMRVESRDSTIIGDLLRVDFTERRMTLTGNVVLKAHGQADGLKNKDKDDKTVRGEVMHKPSSMTGDRLDYDYETRQATLSGNIRMRQGENFGTCDRVLFDEEKNIVRLKGNVHFINGDKQAADGPLVIIWIDSNMLSAPGAVWTFPAKNNRNRGPQRNGEALGDAPQLPPDVLDANNGKLPPPLDAAPAAPTKAAPAAPKTPPPAATAVSTTPAPASTEKATPVASAAGEKKAG